VEFPVPDALALNQSMCLVDVIQDEITANGGRISFSRFMEIALYQPGFGYYSGGARKFGIDGDFTTAPEISRLFSVCLARQCVQIFNGSGVATILELGAGTGVMAADILTELQRSNSLPEKYLILETSADLRQRQQQLLQDRVPEQYPCIQWLDTLPAEPIDGIILANEVLDALPVQRIRVEQQQIMELMVTNEGSSFTWFAEPASSQLSGDLKNILAETMPDLPDGYTTEYNPFLPSFIHSLSDVLGIGVMILIDYGFPRREYYHPQRIDGTLLCHYRHRSHSDPFIFVGIQDISASVDFTLVAESARLAGLEVSGYTTQAGFLAGCGIDDIIRESDNTDVKSLLQYSQQARQLLMPGQMGESFKVIALSRQVEMQLKGFEFMNQIQRL